MMSGVGGAAAEGLIGGLGSVILIVVLIAVVRWIMKLSRAAKSLPQDLAARKVANSDAEERLYDFIRQEIESGEIRSGLWTKAEATANSIENAAIRAKYIQLRFGQLEAQGQHKKVVNEDSAAVAQNHTDTKETSEEISIEQDNEKTDPEYNEYEQSASMGLTIYAMIFVFAILFILLLISET